MSKYGCLNRAPLRMQSVVAAGWYQDGYTRTPKMISIPDPMTKDCQYRLTDLGKVDPKCAACAHKVGA
jgi:hypothetical protein